jgi:hypothetical protein
MRTDSFRRLRFDLEQNIGEGIYHIAQLCRWPLGRGALEPLSGLSQRGVVMANAVFSRKLVLAALSVVGSCAFGLSAQAASRVGTLNCNVSSGVGLVITSSRALSCAFQSSTGRVEYYTGTVQRFGLDIGVTGAGKLGWIVFAATRPGAGALAGTYAGATANVSVGVGVGANALVGGAGNAFTLQPFSVEVQTGVNIAAGVGALRLDYNPPARRARRR